MAGILYISTILLGFIFKKSKIVTALIFLSMIIFTVFCYENADLGSYSLDYDLDHFANDNSRYIGYDYLTHVALSLDIPFDGYRTIFTFYSRAYDCSNKTAYFAGKYCTLIHSYELFWH